jgi:hypothetical protein
MRPSTIAVVAGSLGGLLLVAAFRQSLLGVLIGAMLSPLPLAMVVFGLGASYLPVAVVAGAISVAVMTGSFPLATVYLAVDAAPVAVLSRLGLAAAITGGARVPGFAVGRTVSALVLAAFAAVVVGLAMISAGPDGLEATLRSRLETMLPAMPATDASGGGFDLAATRTEMIKALAGFLPGAAAWDWCLRAIISAGLGQMLLTRMKLAVWPTPDYRGFAAPQWFFALFGVTAIAAVLLRDDAGFIAGNAAAVLSLPLVLQGLAVVHTAAAQTKKQLIWLLGFYVFALVMASVALVALAGLGVMDGFLHIRTRYLARRNGGE